MVVCQFDVLFLKQLFFVYVNELQCSKEHTYKTSYTRYKLELILFHVRNITMIGWFGWGACMNISSSSSVSAGSGGRGGGSSPPGSGGRGGAISVLTCTFVNN